MPNKRIDDAKTAAATTPKLTHEHKADIVRRLAGFETPGAISKSMKKEFGIEISRQAIAFYDPTRHPGRPRATRWTKLFWETRGGIIAGQADVGSVHPMVRVRWLDQMAHVQMDRGNTAEARALLKQAAEEMGRMAGHKEGASDAIQSQISYQERLRQFDVVARRLGYEPRQGHELWEPARALEEPQPPGDPVSG